MNKRIKTTILFAILYCFVTSGTAKARIYNLYDPD